MSLPRKVQQQPKTKKEGFFRHECQLRIEGNEILGISKLNLRKVVHKEREEKMTTQYDGVAHLIAHGDGLHQQITMRPPNWMGVALTMGRLKSNQFSLNSVAQ